MAGRQQAEPSAAVICRNRPKTAESAIWQAGRQAIQQVVQQNPGGRQAGKICETVPAVIPLQNGNLQAEQNPGIHSGAENSFRFASSRQR